MDLLAGIIGILFLLIVIGFAVWWIMLYFKENVTPRNEWITTEGTVYISDIIEYLEPRDSEDNVFFDNDKYETRHRVDIQCVFLVDGVSYRVSPKLIHKGLLKKYPVGRIVAIEYDPKDPNRAEIVKNKPGYEHL